MIKFAAVWINFDVEFFNTDMLSALFVSLINFYFLGFLGVLVPAVPT